MRVTGNNPIGTVSFADNGQRDNQRPQRITLSQTVVLTAAIGEAYTSTVLGADAKVYATKNGTLFAVGQ